MRIVIEPGSYSLRNMGDVAMLQVAVRRMRASCPAAELRVFTNDAAALAAFCPEAIAQPAAGRAPWVSGGALLGRLHRLLPPSLSHALSAARQAAGRRWPAVVATLLAARLPVKARGRFQEFIAAVRGADLLLVVGQGAMADATHGHASTVLSTLLLAQSADVPTAMVGQGMGPLRDLDLRARARAVLPCVRLIALREGRTGPLLLASLGVPEERIIATGDDAVELAYGQRRDSLGTGLGINLRVSGNAGTDEAMVERLREALRSLLPLLGAPPLVPAPIARGVARDADVIRRLTVGLGDGGKSAGEELDSPSRVISRIADCRVLVSGAYHAAVFALAQGIPVVCLAASPYYVDKFRGLLDLFPGGGDLLLLDEPDLPAQLSAAVQRLWRDADAHRGTLLRAAATQVAAGHAAYARVAELLPPASSVPVAVPPVARPAAASLPRMLASDTSAPLETRQSGPHFPRSSSR